MLSCTSDMLKADCTMLLKPTCGVSTGHVDTLFSDFMLGICMLRCSLGSKTLNAIPRPNPLCISKLAGAQVGIRLGAREASESTISQQERVSPMIWVLSDTSLSPNLVPTCAPAALLMQEVHHCLSLRGTWHMPFPSPLTGTAFSFTASQLVLSSVHSVYHRCRGMRLCVQQMMATHQMTPRSRKPW